MLDGVQGDAAEAELAAAIAEAYAARTPLLIEGGGTKRAMLRPVQAARTLSTRALTGIPLYAPKELVVSARAGTTVRELEAALAAQGQHLIAEPPDYTGLLGTPGEATVGGMVAANLAGPRRIAAGATRDHLLGIRAIDGTGQAFHSGGRVLKNVTGLDLCKLLAGSHGTLGVITEATLKVLPRPEATGTVVLGGLGAEAAVAALATGLGSPYGVSAAAWLPAEAAARVPALAALGAAVTLLRIEDFAASTAYRTARLASLLGAPLVLEDAPSRAAWAAIRDVHPLDPGEAVWRVSVRPSAGPGILQATGLQGFLDWGGGLVWLTGPASAHAAVTTAATTAGGTWMLLRAPESLRAAAEVVPPEPPALAAITRRVKAVMDPGFILNPGRLYPGL